MKDKPKILCVLPARAGSKRLKNKNILPINGIPMWRFTWYMVCKSKLIETAYIATDIKEIIDYPRLNIVKRPKEICTDKSPLDDTLRYVIRQCEKCGNKYDYIVMCHCNIPLRKEGEIDKLIKIALKNPDATSVVTGVECEEPVEWQFEQKGKYFIRPFATKAFRKQDIPKRYNVTGSIQVHRVDALMAGTGEAYSYFGDKIIIVPQERKYSYEIDTQEDLMYVEYLMEKDSF